MENIMDRARPSAPETDIVSAVRNVLSASAEPMTLPRIRAALPATLRGVELEALADSLQRQVAANVLYIYPRYRGPHERYWDRPMREHLIWLVRGLVEQTPLSWSEIRRKLPQYARLQACSALEDLLASGELHRHPPTSKRNGPRFGLHPPDPKLYLRPELERAFVHLESLGFGRDQLKQGVLDLMQDDEWNY